MQRTDFENMCQTLNSHDVFYDMFKDQNQIRIVWYDMNIEFIFSLDEKLLTLMNTN